MHIDADRHIDKDIAERYAMRSLARDEAALVEEHLLFCETCRDRVTEADAYVRAMKSAVQRLPVKAAKSHWNFGLVLPAFAVGALLSTALTARRASVEGAEPAAIGLYAVRGTDWQALGHGPSRRPLLLRPDLSGLPAAPSYKMEIVDASGSLKWQGALSAHSLGTPETALVPAEPKGRYFVRVSLPSGEMVREYALELRGSD